MHHDIDIKPQAARAVPSDLPESVALQRLIDEVRNVGGVDHPTTYNRSYHRHNR